MLKTRSAQVGLFDAAVVIGPLPEGSFFALLAEHGDRIVRDCDFAECYSERMGRPSIPPSLLAKVLLWRLCAEGPLLPGATQSAHRSGRARTVPARRPCSRALSLPMYRLLRAP